jgi:hypothetical protein
MNRQFPAGRLLCALLCLMTTLLPARAGYSQNGADSDAALSFPDGTLKGWQVEGENTWSIGLNPEFFVAPGQKVGAVANSLEKGEANTGVLRSPVFIIRAPVQSFFISGWDGTLNGQNDGDRNWVQLRSYPDGAILRRAHTPGGNKLVRVKWITADLQGRRVYLEVVDANPVIRPGGFAWIAFGGYRQEVPTGLKRPLSIDNLFAVKLDSGAEMTICRTLPFMAALPERRGETRRQNADGAERLPVGVGAKTLYLLGMINEGWDYGVAHWGEHPELRAKRDDQVYIGARIGEIEIRYAAGNADRIPLIIGATAWFVAQWAHGPTHGVSVPIREPFASRPEYDAVLRRALKLREDSDEGSSDTRHKRYYLAIRPRPLPIREIVVHDNPALRGRPLVSAVTLEEPASREGLRWLGRWTVEEADLQPAVSANEKPDWKKELESLARTLYTSAFDLPKKVSLLPFPKEFDAAQIRFLGGREAVMLTNLWTANLQQMDEKFERKTGNFRETAKDCPWYGGYSGIGTWAPIGVYADGAYARTSDHYVTLALRCIRDPLRAANYVDFCDKWLYYYRADHDPARGPANPELDIAKYPKDAPPHWAFVLNGPYSLPWPINEIPGNEEMDGHGATCVGRWVAWRMLGAPKGEWLTAPRPEVYGKSRWDSTRDAADFICWLMDYTRRDVIWSEGETTGWAGGPHLPLAVAGMPNETDPVKIRSNYANADMYEPYPTWACLTALRCSAQMAEAVGDTERARKWRAYADRLQAGMIRLLKVGDHNRFVWRVSPYSVLPSLQDSLVPGWFCQYRDGYDPLRWDPTVMTITRNTLERQLSQRYGFAPVLGMGYGQGWITHAALALDDLDSAGKLLVNLAKYCYDKNLDYSDPKRGIDWRRWLWLIPEGTHILPDGRWYRIGDLSNGANQGPAMHALETCAGVDDTDPRHVRILPRAPEPLNGLEVENFLTLVPEKEGLGLARVKYRFLRPGAFTLQSDCPLPHLSVRLGPFPDLVSARCALEGGVFPAGSTRRLSLSGTYRGRDAIWLWVENMREVREIDIRLVGNNRDSGVQ